MTEVEEYKVLLIDADGRTVIYKTDITTLNSNDKEHSIDLIVGMIYNVVVCSVNSVGASQSVSTSFGKFYDAFMLHIKSVTSYHNAMKPSYGDYMYITFP